MKLNKCKCGGMWNTYVDAETGEQGIWCLKCKEDYPDRTEELEKEIVEYKDVMEHAKHLEEKLGEAFYKVGKLEKENAELKKRVFEKVKEYRNCIDELKKNGGQLEVLFRYQLVVRVLEYIAQENYQKILQGERE